MMKNEMIYDRSYNNDEKIIMNDPRCMCMRLNSKCNAWPPMQYMDDILRSIGFLFLTILYILLSSFIFLSFNRLWEQLHRPPD